MRVVHRLWADDAGFVVSTELVLVAVLVVLGLIVGLATIRDQLVQELGDVAAAISDINQSYSFSGVAGHSSSTAGSQFIDVLDFCDAALETTGTPPACIAIDTVAATPEG